MCKKPVKYEVNTTLSSRTDAKAACVEKKGNLATVRNKGEVEKMKFITSGISDSAGLLISAQTIEPWIGLNYDSALGVQAWDDGDPSIFRNMKGTDKNPAGTLRGYSYI